MNATHFIEVYKSKTELGTTGIHKIKFMQSFLEDTYIFGWQTIAIFKIRLK